MNRRHLFKRAATASFFLASILFVACESRTPSPAPPPKTAAGVDKVYVVFEGPWAIVSDPKNPNGVVALRRKPTVIATSM